MVYRTPGEQDEGTLDDGWRTCRKCTVRQHITEFHWVGRARKYRFRECKTCGRGKPRRSRPQTPESREWYLADRYRLTPSAYDALTARHPNGCFICNKTPDSGLKIDHNHATGKVRGLLCTSCNTALGGFKDSPELLRSAISYLASPPAVDIEHISDEVYEAAKRKRRSESSKRSWDSRRSKAVQRREAVV